MFGAEWDETVAERCGVHPCHRHYRLFAGGGSHKRVKVRRSECQGFVGRSQSLEAVTNAFGESLAYFSGFHEGWKLIASEIGLANLRQDREIVSPQRQQRERCPSRSPIDLDTIDSTGSNAAHLSDPIVLVKPTDRDIDVRIADGKSNIDHRCSPLVAE